MPDNRISENDAFDLLNSEFSNFALEKENARNLEALRRRNGQQQPQKAPAVVDEEDIDEDDEDDSGGRGCVGTFFRILIILLLAGAVAWIIFMPQGSLGELWDKFSPNLSAAYSWAAGLLGGDPPTKTTARTTATMPAPLPPLRPKVPHRPPLRRFRQRTVAPLRAPTRTIRPTV